ncbi:DUF4956 domain-containing protein [Carboxylicivirga sp. N1Y90]|uniref:DUF4956 domain-containing protein n=1 Tax=Carboxylicivirga fragile TaxID=3417571 RepID=UPI003D33243C|nr:DUF4956 domain-containing protein [Marinilabiliaceae bacterium N1Y90]
MILDILNTVVASDVPIEEVASWEDQLRFLGIKLINVGDFSELLVRFILSTGLIFSIVHFMYAKHSKRKDYYFSYLAIGVMVFLMCFLLNNVKLELGFALGLFAIFGIIRYRTDAIPIKEMTYLFIIIGVAVVNALASKKVSYAELLFTNMAILFGLWILEKRLMLKQELSVKLIYEKIENIHSLKHDELLNDLKNRTGININRYEVEKIDFLRDVAEFTLYYNANGNDEQGKFK